MAYGVKYTCEQDVHINGTIVNYRISLRQKNFINASTEVLASSEFFTLNYENTSTSEFLSNPLQKGRLEFYLMVQDAQDQLIIDNIADSSEDDWQMDLYVDDVLYWRGWVLPDLLQFSQGSYPYAVTITAKDFTILGSLEYPLDEQVVRASGNKYGSANLKAIIHVLCNLIAKSNLDINAVSTYTNWVNSDAPESDQAVDFLQTTFIRPFALRNYGNNQDGDALLNIRIGDGSSNFIENYTVANDSPISVESALSIVLKNFGLFMRQAEGEIKIYQISALNAPFNTVNKTTYNIDSFGDPVFGFFGVNLSAISTENITQAVSSDTFILPDSNNAYLPSYKEIRATYNHRTNLDKLRLSTVDLVGYSGNTENTIESEELIYPDGASRLYIQYDVEASFRYNTSVDLTGIMRLGAWVDVELMLSRPNADNLYYSTQARQWITTETYIRLPFQNPTRTIERGAVTGELLFRTGFNQFITEPIPAGEAGRLILSLRPPKGIFTAISQNYYQPNFLDGVFTLEPYNNQTGDTVFFPSIASDYKYNSFNTRLVFDQSLNDLLKTISQKDGAAVVNNTLTCSAVSESIAKGERVFYDTVINSQTIIESSLTVADIDEGDTSIPLELVRGVPPSNGGIYLQDQLTNSSSTTYVLTNTELVSSATFDYGTVLYGDGITSNSIGAIVIRNNDVIHDNSTDTWVTYTPAFIDSFSKWRRKTDDTSVADGSLFKLLLREAMEGRGVVINSQLVHRPNRIIQATLYAPYFGHKLLQVDGQNFLFIGGTISGNGFSNGVFMQVPNRTPKSVLTNLLSQGTDGTFSSTRGAIANFSQSFANSQFISQTTEALTGTITSIPINPIAFSIGNTGDAISVIDNASGNIVDFVLSQTYNPNDLNIIVESKTLIEPLAKNSFVVYDAERVTSYITQSDTAIRLGVRSLEYSGIEDASGVEYQLADGAIDSINASLQSQIQITADSITSTVQARLNEDAFALLGAPIVLGNNVTSLPCVRQESDQNRELYFRQGDDIRLFNSEGNSQVFIVSQETIVSINQDIFTLPVTPVLAEYGFELNSAIYDPVTLGSTIRQLADQIVLKVNSDGVIALVQLDADADEGSTITISSDNINLEGIANFLSTSPSFINDISQQISEDPNFTAVNVYEQASKPTGGTYNVGDVWLEVTANGKIPYVYDGTDFIRQITTIDGGEIKTGIIDVGRLNVGEIYSKISGDVQTAINDGSVNLFIQPDQPTEKEAKVGDIWIDSDDEDPTGDPAFTYQGSGVWNPSFTHIKDNTITTSKIQARQITGTLLDIEAETKLNLSVTSAQTDSGIDFNGLDEYVLVANAPDSIASSLGSSIELTENSILSTVYSQDITKVATLIGSLNAGSTYTGLVLKGEEATTFKAGTVLRLVNPQGQVTLVTISNDVTIGTITTRISVNAFTPEFNYGQGNAIVGSDNYTASRIAQLKDEIDLNVSSISGANTAIANVNLRVDGTDASITTINNTLNANGLDLSSNIESRVDATEGSITTINNTLTDQILGSGESTIISRVTATEGEIDDLQANIVLATDVNGNIASLDLSSNTTGSAIDIKADQITLTGSTTFIGDVFAENIDLTGTISGNSYTPANAENGTGDGFFLGKYATPAEDPEDPDIITYEFGVGNGAKRLYYNGDTLSLDGAEVGSTQVSIGGTGTIKTDPNALGTGSGTSVAGVVLNSSGIFAGAADQDTSDANFRVNTSGALVANSATITGTVTSSNITVTGGSINLGDGVFNVTNEGALTATSATITGAITATSGTLKSLDVQGTITVGKLNQDPTPNVNGIIQSVNYDTSKGFKLDGIAGKLTAVDADLSGKITSTQGAIGGWNIGTTQISSDASTEKRIVLDKTLNRITIADNAESKAVMGYLEGVIRGGNNNTFTITSVPSSTTFVVDEAGWDVDEFKGLEVFSGGVKKSTVTSNTSDTITTVGAHGLQTDDVIDFRYTDSNYGFWADKSNAMVIEGQIDYRSGDWLISGDANLKIFSGNNEIIRLGSASNGENGLFLYNTSGDIQTKITNTSLQIGDGATYNDVVGGKLTYNTTTGKLTVSGNAEFGGTLTAGAISSSSLITSSSLSTTLGDYVLSTTLDSYYTATEVDNLIPTIPDSANTFRQATDPADADPNPVNIGDIWIQVITQDEETFYDMFIRVEGTGEDPDSWVRTYTNISGNFIRTGIVNASRIDVAGIFATNATVKSTLTIGELGSPDVNGIIQSANFNDGSGEGETAAGFKLNGLDGKITAVDVELSGKITAGTGSTFTQAMITDLSVDTADIADLAVNNAKIADATITSAKIDEIEANKITIRSISDNTLFYDNFEIQESNWYVRDNLNYLVKDDLAGNVSGTITSFTVNGLSFDLKAGQRIRIFDTNTPEIFDDLIVTEDVSKSPSSITLIKVEQVTLSQTYTNNDDIIYAPETTVYEDAEWLLSKDSSFVYQGNYFLRRNGSSDLDPKYVFNKQRINLQYDKTELYASVYGRVNTSNDGANNGVSIGVVFYDKFGSRISSEGSTQDKNYQSTTYKELGLRVKMGSDRVTISYNDSTKVDDEIINSNIAYCYVYLYSGERNNYFDEFKVQPVLGSVQIQDGAITADKIDVNDLFAQDATIDGTLTIGSTGDITFTDTSVGSVTRSLSITTNGVKSRNIVEVSGIPTIDTTAQVDGGQFTLTDNLTSTTANISLENVTVNVNQNFESDGTIQALNGYKSSDGTAGLTATRKVLDSNAIEQTVTIKDGIITSWTE